MDGHAFGSPGQFLANEIVFFVELAFFTRLTYYNGMIHINNLILSFGQQKIFDHISCTISHSDRIGLVGRNGTGKSTLLKLIAEASCAHNSAISVAKNKQIAYFPQEVVLQSDKSIFDETFSCFEHLSQLVDEAVFLEKGLEADPNDSILLERYAAVQD